MSRVKRGKTHLKRRKNILKKTKGYMWGRKSKLKLAQTAVIKAGKNAYRSRKLKKRTMRGLFQTRIGAVSKEEGISYSKLMGGLKKANVALDRKSLATLAKDYPEVFKKIVAIAKA